VTPSLCTLFVQSSFALYPTNSPFLSLTFEVQTIQLLMLCPVFRRSSSTNSPRRQIWSRRLCPPQRRPSGWSPSLSAVSSHCTFHTSHLLHWNLRVYYLLLFKAMEPLPCIRELQLRYFASWLSNQVSFPTIKLYLAGIPFAHIENSLADPFADAPLLRLLLRGIKRTIGLSSCRRLPITMSVIRQPNGALADDPQIASQDKLML